METCQKRKSFGRGPWVVTIGSITLYYGWCSITLYYGWCSITLYYGWCSIGLLQNSCEFSNDCTALVSRLDWFIKPGFHGKIFPRHQWKPRREKIGGGGNLEHFADDRAPGHLRRKSIRKIAANRDCQNRNAQARGKYVKRIVLDVYCRDRERALSGSWRAHQPEPTGDALSAIMATFMAGVKHVNGWPL